MRQRRRQRANNRFKLIAVASVLTLCVVGMGYMVMRSMGQVVADEYGCFDVGFQKQTAVIVDASVPRWDATQGRALYTYFKQLYAGLAFNEKLMIFTTEGDQIATVVAPRFHVCGQANSQQDLEQIGAAPAQSGYLKRQKERLFEDVFKPQLDALLTQTPADTRLQNRESPILTMIQSVRRDARLESGDRLVLISDLINNSESAKFCQVQFDMPRFSTFVKRRIYQARLKPEPLNGIHVEALMLLRHGYGQGAMRYCTSEEEIRTFWADYFKANGVTNARFIRIRTGAGED